MAFCPNCGAAVEGRFCAKCGATMNAAAPSAPAGGPAYNPPPVAGAGGMSDSVASGLCYILGLLTGILFLVLAPYNQNRSIRFHAFQSIFLHVAGIAFWIVLTIFSLILPWYIRAMIGVLALLVWLGFFILWLIVMIKAFQGGKFVVPVIGPLAEKQANA